MMRIKYGYSWGVIGKDMYSDSTLRCMTKSELIELLMIAQDNYACVLESYGRAVAYSEKLLKHGTWEICSDGYYPYCSECKSEPDGGKMSRYCPNCGARMDGDK